MNEWSIVSLLWLLGALLLVGPSAWGMLRGNRNTLTYVALWLGIALILGLAYTAFG